jgi:hypothetical protein
MFSEKHLELLSYVNANRGGLAPWQSPPQLSVSARYSFVKGFTARTLKGTIFSQENTPLVTFARTESGWGSDGFLFAASSAFEMYCERTGEEFKVMFNREWLGRISPTGQMITVHGQTIGQAMHPPTSSLTIGSIVRFRNSKTSFPFYINNRVIASISVSPDFSEQTDATFAVNENQFGQPIVQLYEQPTPEEEKWLTVFAVLEVAFYGHSMISV